jgi:hypothetical protein
MTRVPVVRYVLLLAVVCGIASPARAQGTPCGPWVSEAYNNALTDRVGLARPEATKETEPEATKTKPPVAPCDEHVADFYKVSEYQYEDANKTAEERKPLSDEVQERAHRARLNEIIIVRVQHLQTLWDQANCIDRANTDKAAKAPGGGAPVAITGCSKKDVLLFLDNRPIAALAPEAVILDAARKSGTLRYHLERKQEAKETWADLIGLDLQGAHFSRDVKLSVGLAGGDPIPTAVTRFHLVRIRGWWLMVWTTVTAIALVIFYLVATRTDLLRDRYPYVELGQRRPYSLAHCQGAWWTGLTLFGFAFIWLVTGQRDFSTTALTLLGITAGTALGAKIIDSSRETATSGAPNDAALQAEIQTALDKKRALETAITAAQAAVAASSTPATLAALEAARGDYRVFLTETRRKFPTLIAPASQGLLIDILSDGTGVSFHRFQMVAWASILGLIFAIELLARLAMPDFDTNLLALLGISTGTYLGLKIPEKT